MVEAAAARVTGDDLRRVLDPRETQAIVMLMRNGDDEHSRRHAAARMRVDFDEFEALVASARRKVEQVKLRKAAATAVEEVRPVEDALLDAAGHGGGGLGRGCARSSVPRGLRGSVLSPAERIERDDDEEAKVATTTRRWDEIRARAAELVERAAPMSVPQRELAQVLDVSGTDFSLQVAPFLKRDPRFLREQESTGKPVEWSLVGSGAGAGPADGGSPASPGDVGSAADQTPVGPVGAGEEFPSAASERIALGGGQPDRSPRERYVDALIGKLDAMDGYEDELCDRIEAQLELLG